MPGGAPVEDWRNARSRTRAAVHEWRLLAAGDRSDTAAQALRDRLTPVPAGGLLHGVAGAAPIGEERRQFLGLFEPVCHEL